MLQLRQGIGPKRCALAAVHFPEARGFSGADTLADEANGSLAPGCSHDAAYDPVFMVPFAFQASFRSDCEISLPVHWHAAQSLSRLLACPVGR